MDNREIVVGTDGSGCATTAVRWAAAEAALRDVPLRVLFAHEGEPPGDVLDAASEAARGVESDLDVRAVAVAGPPVPALLEVAEDAALVVVGGHGHGGVRSLVLGSVSRQVATRAAGSVAVVRGGDPSGPVIVGCDGSDPSRLAVELGFQLAASHDARLLAVRAYYPPSPSLGFGYQPLLYAMDDQDPSMVADLVGDLEPWHSRYPQVPVRHAVVHGGAAGALVARSRSALAIVIGSRGHGAVAETLRGAVCPQLLHRAQCPVVVTHGTAT
ncbi:universal stress protein [Asanoa siamensis]|uniref:Universal stress protein n=1 Tax=Asanoa siamensis TaxID=926357 RepID=A0ABQ4CRC9_9ACTN|nr:universal stress protein [Asanoa siamensis]GIF73844.1 universal stress protein [Asanoa siamensis]